MGDILHSSIILKPIKEKFPDAEIAWLSNQSNEQILRSIKEIDKIFLLDEKVNFLNFFTKMGQLISTIRKIRKEKYDWVIDIQGLFKSGILSYLSKPKSSIGFSKSNARELSHLFYKHRIETKSITNIFLKNLELVSPLLSASTPFVEIKNNGLLEKAFPTFTVVKSKKVDEWIKKEKVSEIVIINPWSSFKNKNLPLENLKLIIKEINRSGNLKPLLIYSKKNELKELKSLEKDASFSFLIVPKISLRELLYLIELSTLYLGVDSGPSYMSFLLKKKTKILFGPTNAKRQGPPDFKSLSFVEKLYSTYPCPIIHKEPISGAYRCLNKNCSNNLCMKKFSIKDVFANKYFS